MKILVVGSGSCEHSVTEKLSESELCEKIYCAPGNSGISQLAECVDIRPEDTAALADFAEAQMIALTVTCSHVPVQHNINERFEAEGLKIFAPSCESAKFFTNEEKKKAFFKKYALVKAGVEKVNGSVYIICLANESSFLCMPPCRFYDKLYDNDEGPVTGGMGAYCPYTFADKTMNQRIRSFIANDVSEAVKKEKIDYRGLLCFKIGIGENDFFLEDISAHIPGSVMASVLALLDSDLLRVIYSACDGLLTQSMLSFSKRACVCVPIVSGGYPGKYQKGFPITFPAPKYNVNILHAGTCLKDDGAYYTDAGHVVSVCATAENIEKARTAAYDAVNKINFSGMYYRSDIAREQSL